MTPLTPFYKNSSAVQLHASLDFSSNPRLLHVKFEVLDPAHEIVNSLVNGRWTSGQLIRTDELWKTTCLEVFWGAQGMRSYWELNLSPMQPRWNLYRFEDYRRPQPAEASPDYELESLEITGDLVQARLRAQQDFGLMEASLCAVVQLPAGNAYYSTRHAGEKPDFHRRDSFLVL